MNLAEIKAELFEIEAIMNDNLSKGFKNESAAYSVAFVLYHRIRDLRRALSILVGDTE
jgi:hypothetical protein